MSASPGSPARMVLRAEVEGSRGFFPLHAASGSSRISLYVLLCPTTGVEQVFRPAVKLISPPASAAAVHRARMHHTLKKYKTLLPGRHADCVSHGAPTWSNLLVQARCLTSEIERPYNQICCRRQVAQLVFCPGFPSPFGGVAQVVRATV